MHEVIRRTLLDLAELLSAHEVPFVVVGGIAVALRGEPRFTADIDVIVGIDQQKALGLLPSLSRSPFETLVPSVEDIVTEAFMLPLRHRTTQVPVDISVGLSGFERQVIARATEESIEGLSIPVATAEDVLLMKMLAARPRDVEDAKGVVARRGHDIDWRYVVRTARDLQDALGQDMVAPVQRLRGEL
jgi:hypothetical protein